MRTSNLLHVPQGGAVSEQCIKLCHHVGSQLSDVKMSTQYNDSNLLMQIFVSFSHGLTVVMEFGDTGGRQIQLPCFKT
jgi:hypothetical protein